MSKISKAEKEILSMVEDFVKAHEDRELWRNIRALTATEEYNQFDDFSTRINLQLDVLNAKVPEKTESINKIRIKVLELFGCEVFENKKRFFRWVDLPNKALGDKTPRSLMNTTAGIKTVFDTLGQIEYGVLS